MSNVDDFDEVTNSQIHEIVEPVVSMRLKHFDFECISELTWVRDKDAPIRQLYKFSKWKGGVFSPMWGVSLDFVPHISGSSLKWHRTNKSALFDLVVDMKDNNLEIDYCSGIIEIKKRIDKVASMSINRANEFWSMSTTVQELPTAFDWIKCYLANHRGFGFYNYIQHPIALAFVLAKNNRIKDAQEEFEKYSQKALNAKNRSKLNKLFHDACIEQ